MVHQDDPPPAEPLLVNLRAAARLLCMSERTAWTLAKRGELRTVRIGRRMIRFSIADLRTFVAERRAGPRPGRQDPPELS